MQMSIYAYIYITYYLQYSVCASMPHLLGLSQPAIDRFRLNATSTTNAHTAITWIDNTAALYKLNCSSRSSSRMGSNLYSFCCDSLSH